MDFPPLPNTSSRPPNKADNMKLQYFNQCFFVSDVYPIDQVSNQAINLAIGIKQKHFTSKMNYSFYTSDNSKY